jgi:hypothetical protein
MVSFYREVAHSNSPIRFYGKLVDQNDEPVRGAKIVASVRHWYVRGFVLPAVAGRMIPLNAQSDRNGLFKLSGASGDGLTIEAVENAEYKLAPDACRSFGALAGSVENPIIFKMRKRP